MDIRNFFTNPRHLLYVLIGVTGLFLLIIILFILNSFSPREGGEVTLQFWGAYDNVGTFNAVLRGFSQKYDNIKVVYTKISPDEYEARLIDALASGKGPDVMMIYNTWVNQHQDKLAAMPETIPVGQTEPLKTLKGYRNEFVDVAYDDFIRDGKIYAMPLYVDTLALYYNKDIFNTAGIATPPATWEEFNRDVTILTKLDDRGNFLQSGAAIGAAHNINRSTDILMDLMIQSGAQMTNADRTQPTFSRPVNGKNPGEQALQYYTDFTNPAKQVYTWNENQHYSIDAFSEGRAGMMFNYSYQMSFLRAKNARLNFAVAPMPQASLDDIKNFANYWAPAVSAASKYPMKAWQFINYLTSSEGARIYLDETNRPAARRDLVDMQRNDPDLGVFAIQALSAKSWAQVYHAATERIFAEMIDDVNLGKLSVSDALQSGATKVEVLFQKNRR